MSAIRNARRCGSPIRDQARTANRHLTEQFAQAEFVTGLLLQLEVPTGHGVIINAGHPPPLLLRAGTLSILNLSPDAPLGLSPDTDYRVQAIRLRPGDRLLLLTGIEEAHDVAGPEFGLDRVADLPRSHADLPAVEFVRLLTKAVTDYRSGPLADRATAVCLDWYPINNH